MTTATHPRHVHVEPVMGSVASIDVRGVSADFAADGIAAASRWLHWVDRTFSTYRAESEISRIARGELTATGASPEVREILDRCEQLREETGGAFDAYATRTLDPSALVKGWSVQRASELMARHGLHDHCIGVGGDLVCRGESAPGAPWRIGIQHPTDRDAVAARVAIRGGAVATSGLYERGAHILDPPTGLAPQAVLSVTVTGPDLGLADAYATAAFVKGESGPAWTLALPGYEALTILADGTVLSTPGFPTDHTTTAPASSAAQERSAA